MTVRLFYTLTKNYSGIIIYMLFKWVVRTRGRRETVNEESPSVSGTGCRRNPGEGDFKESATENYRPYFLGVRLKRRGKSPPLLR